VKKILITVMAVALSLGLMGGAFAYFSDTETSTGNTFTAGTLDLTLGETGGAPITLNNMKPGDTASGTMTVTNVGTLAGSLYATSWYVANDGTAPTEFPTDMSADDVAKMLQITTFTVGAFDMFTHPNIATIKALDGDSSDFTVYDMVNDASGVTLAGYPDPTAGGHGWYSYDTDMTSAESHVISMTIQFDTAADNDYQNDGITLTFEFLLTQLP